MTGPAPARYRLQRRSQHGVWRTIAHATTTDGIAATVRPGQHLRILDRGTIIREWTESA